MDFWAFLGYFVASIPLIGSAVLLRLSFKYRKANDLRHAVSGFIIFAAAVIYLEFQAPFLAENLIWETDIVNILFFLLGIAAFILPIFFILFALSIVLDGRFMAAFFSLLISVPLFFIARQFQVGALGGGFLGGLDYLYVILVYFLFIIISFIVASVNLVITHSEAANDGEKEN